MNPRRLTRPHLIAAAGFLCAAAVSVGAALVSSDKGPAIRWVVAGTDAQPQGRHVPLTDGVRAEVLRAWAATQPGTQPATPATPATQPTAPAAPADTREPPLAPGARRVVVPAGGDLPAALRQLRHGDHLVLSRGGPGKPAPVYRGGLNVGVACWIGAADGDGPRPVVEAPAGLPAVYTAASLDWLTISGLEIRPANPDDDRAKARSHGITLYGAVLDARVEDCLVHQFTHDLVAQGKHRSVTIDRCTLRDAWGGPDEPYAGQGFYAECPPTCTILVRDSYLLCNGGRRRKPNQYDHALYGQANCAPVVLLRCVVAGNACGGLQVRSGTTATDCLMADNGVSVLACGADAVVTLRRTTIVGGHRYTTPTGEWTGDMAVSTYARNVVLDDVVIAGVDGQDDPSPDGTRHDVGALVGSRVYPSHPEWSGGGGYTVVGPLVLAGWPGLDLAGDHPPALPKRPDVVVLPDPVRLPDGWTDKVRAGKVSAAAGRQLIAQLLGAN